MVNSEAHCKTFYIVRAWIDHCTAGVFCWVLWVLPVKAQLISDSICNCLCVRSRPRTAAEYAVVYGGQLVSNTVGNVSPAQKCDYRSVSIQLLNGCCCDVNQTSSARTETYPVVVLESAPITTPPSNSTAIIVVCKWMKHVTFLQLSIICFSKQCCEA